MKTPVSDLHPFTRFRREQRFMSTPIGAFHVWLVDQYLEAEAFHNSESLKMKEAVDADSIDLDELEKRVELASQVMRDIERSIQHIEVFRGVMLHEQNNPKP